MENYPQGNILYNREAIETALYNAVAYVVGPDIWDEIESDFFAELEVATKQHDDIKQHFEKTDHVCVGELPF